MKPRLNWPITSICEKACFGSTLESSRSRSTPLVRVARSRELASGTHSALGRGGTGGAAAGCLAELAERRAAAAASPDGADRSNCIIRVKAAGFCGSDRGIWWRRAFGDMILNSLDDEGKDRRVVGHELLGEIVSVGDRVFDKYGYEPGMVVSTESHL